MRKLFQTLAATVPLAFAQSCSQESATVTTPSAVNKALADFATDSAKDYPIELLEAGRQGTEELRASGILGSALNVGDRMPRFALDDAFGETVRSDDLLSNGPLIVVFYRGAWCPFCNIYLHGMQKRLEEFRAQGADLVAISVEPADTSQAVAQKNDLNYFVLSDPNLTVARKFGIVYEMPQVLNEAILEAGFDMAKYNNMEKAELPLSATYIVDRDGTVTYAFLDADYKKRADPNALLEVLATMRTRKIL